jgi:hypothetical protein
MPRPLHRPAEPVARSARVFGVAGIMCDMKASKGTAAVKSVRTAEVD